MSAALPELERLAEACDKYGLPHSVDALLTHIEGNRALAHAFDERTIEHLTRENERLRTLLVRAADHLLTHDETCVLIPDLLAEVGDRIVRPSDGTRAPDDAASPSVDATEGDGRG